MLSWWDGGGGGYGGIGARVVKYIASRGDGGCGVLCHNWLCNHYATIFPVEHLPCHQYHRTIKLLHHHHFTTPDLRLAPR